MSGGKSYIVLFANSTLCAVMWRNPLGGKKNSLFKRIYSYRKCRDSALKMRWATCSFWRCTKCSHCSSISNGAKWDGLGIWPGCLRATLNRLHLSAVLGMSWCVPRRGGGGGERNVCLNWWPWGPNPRKLQIFECLYSDRRSLSPLSLYPSVNQ